MNYNRQFQEDELRHSLLTRGKLNEFRESYNTVYKFHNTNTSDFWGDVITTKHDPNDHMRDDRIEKVCSILSSQKGRLLNIGIGEGLLEQSLYKKNKYLQKYGLDITTKGLRFARERCTTFPVCGSINDLPYKAKSFDNVVCLEVIEHLPSHQTFNALHEIRRVLKHNGNFVLSIPINEKYDNEHNPNRHMRRYTEEIITKELQLSNFTIRKVLSLFAFKRHYRVKTFIAKHILAHRWKPNNVIIHATKL